VGVASPHLPAVGQIGDRTDPRHGLKPFQRLIVLGEPLQSLVEVRDLDIKVSNMIEIPLPQFPY
jgi:hypothetical protein